MGRYLFGIIVLLYTFSVSAQNKPKPFVSKDSLYNENIKKSRLYGVYIPRDIPDAVQKLMELTEEKARESLKKIDEETVARKLFFGLGRWMSYNWNFDEGSRFSHYLRNKGLYDTDDMVTFMLITFHRNIMNKPLDSDNLLKKIIADRQKKNEEEKKKRETIISITPKKD
ncbi:MAG TPA: hypothetical protein PK047_03885 [Saprospiraceae bacterium]|nr:hypothetical protein [Saprospiraceae bacterium]HRO07981.1 hypothetical protein [Saprospiraceae bacterium]HRP41476.1 hypothetical protein [Saprospiraceae bacterium]